MNPAARLRTCGCIRSGEYTDPATHRRLPIPPGFRYYPPRPAMMPERVRAEAERILRAHPRTKWIIAPRY